MSPWTIAHQAPLSMGFPRQEYWSGLHFLLQGSSWPRDQTQIFCIGRQILYRSSTREAPQFLQKNSKIHCHVFPFRSSKDSTLLLYYFFLGLPWWLSGKNSPTKQETGLIPGSERLPEEGNSNPLQYACLGNPMDRGAWWATVCGTTTSCTQSSD